MWVYGFTSVAFCSTFNYRSIECIYVRFFSRNYVNFSWGVCGCILNNLWVNDVVMFFEIGEELMIFGLEEELMLCDEFWWRKIGLEKEWECECLWLEKWQKVFALFSAGWFLINATYDLCVCPNGSFWLVEILCFISSLSNVNINSFILFMSKSLSSALIGGRCEWIFCSSNRWNPCISPVNDWW